MITLPRGICVDLNQALEKEWLVANGIGGYASRTIIGVNTRRYHGLLVAALKPPVDRVVLLSNVDVDAEIDGRIFYLSSNEYPDGKIYPDGYVYIDEFRICDGMPTTIYRVAGNVVHKTVWMERGHNTTYLRYTYVEGTGDCNLTLHPMCNYRDYHGVTKGSLDWNFQVEPVEGGCRVKAREDSAPMWLTTSPCAAFTQTGVWYWNHVYRKEIERGFEGKEDLYVPGVFRATLRPGESLVLVASTEPPEATAPLLDNALEREQTRQDKLIAKAGFSPEVGAHEAADFLDDEAAFASQLTRTADTFIVSRDVNADGKTIQVPTIIAGYHWSTDWGRDTMIALPGLCIPTGRMDEANKTLRTFALFVKDGLLPNNFPDTGEPPQYNTADATLWFFQAIYALASATGDLSVARDLYPLLVDIINAHVRGTLYGIQVDTRDGLLCAGQEGVQLTWMDAKVEDWVVTPRTGKPVEINALWYNALRIMHLLTSAVGPSAKPVTDVPDFVTLAGRVRGSFRRRFWYKDGGYLYDVVDGPAGSDPSLRPNQLLALSLAPDLISNQQARQVLAAVRRHLLTPYGLRTLSPADPAYEGLYIGDRRKRDGAYHQGTVWAWLLGAYFDAVRQIEGRPAAQAELRSMMPALRAQLADAGLGSISEIFDGNPPHTPRGCVSQAWSVAEVLRLVWGPGNLLR